MRERPSFAPEARLLADQGDKQQRNVTIRQMPPVSLAGIPTVNAPPSGTQDVRVKNPPPPPNVSTGVPLSPVTRRECLSLIRQSETRRHQQTAKWAASRKSTAPLLKEGSVPPSERTEISIEGERLRYRVRRGEQWISLLLISFQHL